MSVGTTFLKVQKFVVKNAPTILAIVGSIGAVTSAGLAVHGTLKAQEELKRREMTEKGESYYKSQQAKHLLEAGDTENMTDICKAIGEDKFDSEDDAAEYITTLITTKPMSTTDKILFYAKHYAPAVIVLGASVFCILSGNHISKARILELTGALALSRKQFVEYKSKVEEIVGKKKATDINDEVIHDRIIKNPPSESNTYIPSMGNMPELSLWYDAQSDRYFYSSLDYIRRAELEANRQLEKNGSLTRNDVYGILGIKEIDLAQGIGWIYDPDPSGVHQEVVLSTGADFDDKGNLIGTLEMNDIELPSNQWCGEV